jgi:2-succinyl-6-hydroxy-2,4-cyclohexadiene-1-carboxylate synthase
MSVRREREERFVDACGVRLRAIGEGEGEPVLVLHGFTGDAESMESVVPPLLGKHCVVRLELIGHGGSDSPVARDAYTMNVCAEQISAAAQALGLERPHLLGYSMGGRAAIAAAVANSEGFSSLVLVGATAGIADSSLRRERILADQALADRIEQQGVESFVDEWMALPIFASQTCLGPEALERARAQRLRNKPVGLANSLRGMGAGAQEPLFDRLDRFAGPVLLVVGEQDQKFRNIAASLEMAFPDARTEILEGAGHAAHLERPDAFGRAVSAFLANSSRRRSGTASDRASAAQGTRRDRA